jgi:hypothetical protein
MSFPLPPPTRQVGKPNPAGDMDQVINALVGMGAARLVGPSGDPTGVKDTAAVNTAVAALGGQPGTIYLADGVHYWQCGAIVVGFPGVSIEHIGPKWACVVNAVGTGDTFRMYSPSNYAGLGGGPAGGGLKGFIIDGASAGAGSSGFHIGDIYNLEFNVGVRGFQGSGSIGAWFDNQYTVNGCEQATGKIWAEKNTDNVVFDNSTGVDSGSYDRARLDIFLDMKGVSNGVALRNGAFIYNGKLGIFGNSDSNSTTQYSVLTITGQNGIGYSQIVRSIINVGMELNTTNTYAPITINFGSLTNNLIIGCAGLMDFAGSSLAFTSAGVNANTSFQYDGPVYGDANLFRVVGHGQTHFAGGVLGNGGTVVTRFTSLYRAAPAGNITGVILETPLPIANSEMSQVITVVNYGAGSITFAAAGTSHVADGTGSVIAANTGATFVWDYSNGIWFRIA